ncbi:MAG: serine hydrolase domain-containing protein, partial [Bacteroidota bacterium]
MKVMLSDSKKTFLLLCAIIVLLVPFRSQGQKSARRYKVDGKTYKIASLNKKIEFMMKDVGIPGISLAVIDEGKIVFSNTYGYQDMSEEEPEKVNDETLFQAASLSKNFVTYAAYKLVDDDMLDLDKPMYEYMEYDRLKHDERYKQITARMVLSHSSGLENHKEDNNKDLLEIFHDPGTDFRYSGEGYLFLASVMAQLLDKPVKEYLKEIVYDPLNLKRTFTLGTGEATKNHAAAHDQFGRHLGRWKNHIAWIESHIHTTATDYANLLLAIFDGGLSEESVEQIWTPVVP